MQQDALTPPPFTPEEARTRATFLAMMWSLSYPGRVHALPEEGEPLALIGETLLDLETSFYTPDENLHDALAPTGSRSLPPQRASYHFYPALTEALLAAVAQASIGTLLYPDTAATIILGCTIGEGHTLRLTGPGIPPEQPRTAQIGGLPANFWELRKQSNRYPRGWDILLVDGRRMLGLPRTTQIAHLDSINND